MSSRLDESPIALSFTLNGQPVRVDARPKRSALDVLREGLGVRSLKPGCSPQGICGCCATLIDDKVRLTCTLPARSLEGKQVTTLDGLSEGERELLARAFAESGALRCGYCAPGIAMQTHALLTRLPEPSDEDIGKALNGHLCRCAGWSSLFDAVRGAAALKKAENTPRFTDAIRELALGEVAFVDDIEPPGMLHAALVWTPIARGRVIRIDAGPALAVQGVRAVLTAEHFGSFAGRGLVAVGAEVGDFSDAVALVLADTRELAYGGRELVAVEVEPLPVMSEVSEASRQHEPARALCSRGSLNTALDEAGLVLAKGSFRTQRVEPGFIEAEATLAAPIHGGGMRVLSAGERPGEDQRAVAAALGWPLESVQVEGVASGGAFGAKAGARIQVFAALAARQIGRPVKISLDMEEGMRLHPKRPPVSARLMVGARSDGALVGLKALVLADVGATDGDAVAQAIARQLGAAYSVPHVEVEVRAVRTDNPPSDCVFGFGMTEVAFALESCMDRLAEQLGIDPITLRQQNLEVGARALLESLRSDDAAARAAGLPVGVAWSEAHQVFDRPVEVALSPQKTGEILVQTAFSDVGQGLHAALVALAAAETGLPAARFVPATDPSLAGGSEHAGWTVSLCCGALKLAAAALRAKPGRRAKAAWPPAATTLRAGSAQLAILEPDGKLQRVVVASAAGPDAVALRSGVVGAALMGVGAALSEELLSEAGVPDLRLRGLGMIKSSQTPTIEVRWVADSGYCPYESADLAIAPAAAALEAAIHTLDGERRQQLPMKETPTAWSVGVRRTRGKTT